jgi:hypothetical protein
LGDKPRKVDDKKIAGYWLSTAKGIEVYAQRDNLYTKDAYTLKTHHERELPEVQMRLSTLGFDLDFRNSEQFGELIIKDHRRYGAIIRESGTQPE